MFRVIWQYEPHAIGDFDAEHVLRPAVIAAASHSTTTMGSICPNPGTVSR